MAAIDWEWTIESARTGFAWLVLGLALLWALRRSFLPCVLSLSRAWSFSRAWFSRREWYVFFVVVNLVWFGVSLATVEPGGVLSNLLFTGLVCAQAFLLLRASELAVDHKASWKTHDHVVVDPTRKGHRLKQSVSVAILASVGALADTLWHGLVKDDISAAKLAVWVTMNSLCFVFYGSILWFLWRNPATLLSKKMSRLWIVGVALIGLCVADLLVR